MSQNETAKRILVSENSIKIQEIDNEFDQSRKSLVDKVNLFINRFNKLEIGNIDDALFKKVMKAGIDEYTNKSFETLNKQLAKSGITMSTIVDQVAVSHSSKISELRSAYNDLLAYDMKASQTAAHAPTLQDVTITNSGVEVNEKDLEGRKDQLARRFIESDLGLSLYAKGEQLAFLLNEINGIIKSSGAYNITDITDFAELAHWRTDVPLDQAEMTVNKEGIYQLAGTLK